MPDMFEVFYWVGVGIGCVLGVLAFVALLGCFLPRFHVATRSFLSQQPPEEVWKVLTDFAATPGWHPEIKTVERVPDARGRDIWREVDRRGYPMLLETIEAVPPRRLVRDLGDEGGPFAGQWIFTLEPEGEGCRVSLTERGQIPNPFFRTMFRLFMTPTFYIELYLKALAVRLGDAPVLQRPRRS